MGLPTPMAVIGAFVVPHDVPRVLPAYEAAMVRGVECLCAAIPNRDLPLQWDGRFPTIPPIPHMQEIVSGQFARLTTLVPREVELGFHLCYGDMDAKHFVEPADLGKAAGRRAAPPALA